MINTAKTSQREVKAVMSLINLHLTRAVKAAKEHKVALMNRFLIKAELLNADIGGNISARVKEIKRSCTR